MLTSTIRTRSSAEELESLRSLLRQRFPDATLPGPVAPGVLSCEITALDALLPGGLPRGAMTLFSGFVSSGKTGLALAFASNLTRSGGRLAWVHQGSFSAPSAQQAGVELDSLLAVRTSSFEETRRCADFLLRYQAFELVVIDWPGRGGGGKAWTRLHRLVTGSEQALLVLTPSLRPADPLRYCASLILDVERDLVASQLKLRLGKSRYGRAGEGSILPCPGRPGELLLLPELPGLGQEMHDEVG